MLAEGSNTRRPGEDSEAWPNGARCGVSLCFDDACASQLHIAVPALARRHVRATFYPHTSKLRVARAGVRADLQRRWGAVRDAGHEIGNHSETHPCSANFEWVRRAGSRGLEDLTLSDMENEIDSAQRFLSDAFGAPPSTFAYPCGMTFVGRGVEHRSYVPLVARRFVVGRGFNSECAASPLRCDLACTPAVSMDNRTAGALHALIDSAMAAGQWLILVGHSVSDRPGPYNTDRRALEEVLSRLEASGGAIWVDTVHAIGSFLARRRAADTAGLRNSGAGPGTGS
jgi:peptidoglycan/xylan/chitin deacetylase (PgdA/CDA1 family)